MNEGLWISLVHNLDTGNDNLIPNEAISESNPFDLLPIRDGDDSVGVSKSIIICLRRTTYLEDQHELNALGRDNYNRGSLLA